MAIKLQYPKIPKNPGVYFFKNAHGKILYIGKAANLRARLKSYFVKNQTSLKTKSLITEAKNLDWKVLNSEVEALIHEAELIKKYLPKYNVLMRDDKQYFYVGFSKKKFPKIFITHQPSHKPYGVRRTAEFIGPFTEGGALRSVLKTLRRVFPYCTCKNPHKRLCLNARIGRCFGFCCVEGATGETEKYKKNISSIKKILSGKNKSLARELKKEMRQLSDARKYEEAGKIRDQIMALEKVFKHREAIKQDLPAEFAKALRALESILGISYINRIEAYDIANIHGRFAYGSMAVFADGKIQKNAYRLFKIKSVRGSNDTAMFREVIFRRLKHNEWPCPEIILVDGGKPQLNAAISSAHSIFSRLTRQAGSDASQKSNGLRFIALTKNKKHIGDHIFIGGETPPIPLSRLPEPLKNLILMLDSEAHRFAISHYRKLHRKHLLT